MRRKGVKYTRGVTLPCPKCGQDTQETKDLSMSTRRVDFGRQQMTFADDDDEDGGGYYGYYSGSAATGNTADNGYLDEGEDDEDYDEDDDEDDDDEEDDEEDGCDAEADALADKVAQAKV